jgi:hypothetical protein
MRSRQGERLPVVIIGATKHADGTPIGSARLRKYRNRFAVLPAPAAPMSTRTVIGVPASAIRSDVEHLARWFIGETQARERFRWALRDSLDELLDGQRTGRWCYQHLTKTEKTYLGTAVEINFTREFGFPDGERLDWALGGEDLDCKFSKDFGGWEIPMEMYRCRDHGDQSGTQDHAALLLWMDDDNHRWAAGLLRVTDSLLRFRKDGNRQYNRDNKRKISAEGLSQISWLWGGIQHDLPENVLLHMDPELRARVFASQTSGQQRVNALFRELPARLISRAAILTVAQQDDSLKRARDARLPQHLGGEGFLVLGHQEADPYVAQLLKLPVPAKGEFVSCRVTPVDRNDGRPKVFLIDRWWAIATLDDAPSEAPPRERFRISQWSMLARGPTH